MSEYTRPEITEERINQIRSLIAENPSLGRTAISTRLCELWDWRSPNGQLKDISCRDMLRALNATGRIVLPAPKNPGSKAGVRLAIKHFEHDETPITARLQELLPLRVSVITTSDELDRYKSYIDQYHYLGFDRTVGENMKYMVYSHAGAPLSCLLFGSAAWSCRGRDLYIGWGKDRRARGLNLLTNNTRYLIYPWVRVPHLASHILSKVTRRLADDWRAKYGHGIVCVETFVERRFQGTCYKAANWIYVGGTTGRGRDGGHHNAVLPLKDIYLYPLDRNFKERLRGMV